MPADRPRITRVKLRNYRSIASCDVPLNDLTLLVGPNGSGKSNFLDAIAFLRDAMDSLSEAVRVRGGMRDISYQGCGTFSVECEFSGEHGQGSYRLVVGTDESGAPRVTSEEWTDQEQGRQFLQQHPQIEEAGPLSGKKLLFGERFPADEVGRSGLGGAAGVTFTVSLFQVFNPVPGVLRYPQEPDPAGRLGIDGRNVPSRFRGLQEAAHRVALEEQADQSGIRLGADAIHEYMCAIVPGLRAVVGVALSAPESLETVRFTVTSDQGDGLTLPARAMSDGTLRAFAVLVVLFSAVDGTVGTRSWQSPLAVEEPEASLHPAAARVLLAALKEASERRQVLATTHSPDLLDRPCVEADEILAVRYIRGRSYVGPLDEVGRAALAEELYTVGELLRTDQLLPDVPGEKPLRFDA